MSDERRPRPAAQYGPTAVTVAENVQRLRKRRELSIYQLSALLRERGRPITPAAVGKIERQQRQVTVDDLAALAVIFGVSPAALLLPLTDKPTDPVEVTGGGTVTADDAWGWANGDRPLRYTEGREPTDQMEHQLFGVPQWLRTITQGPVTGQLTGEGSAKVDEFREAFRQEHGRLPDRNEVLNWLFGVTPESGTDG
jgi:transcriptional regulator with XRE-family HTH domain